MGQEALSCFLYVVFSFIHLGVVMEGILNLMLLSPSCQFCASLTCSYAGWEQLFILSSSSSPAVTQLNKDITADGKTPPHMRRQNASWTPEPQPQEPAGPRVLSSFSPYIFLLKRKKGFISEPSTANPYLAESKDSRVGSIWHPQWLPS